MTTVASGGGSAEAAGTPATVLLTAPLLTAQPMVPAR